MLKDRCHKPPKQVINYLQADAQATSTILRNQRSIQLANRKRARMIFMFGVILTLSIILNLVLCVKLINARGEYTIHMMEEHSQHDNY